MRITLTEFKGMRPVTAAHLLAAGEAQEAVNVDLDGGDLRALARPLKVAAASGTSIDSLWYWEENSTEHWIEFTSDVDLRTGPLADDAYERVYFTGLTEPRFFANDNITQAGSPPAPAFDPTADYIKLGVPAPAGVLAASGYSTGSVYRAYVYTYVNRYGEEGPPSPVLEVSNYASGNVTLTGFDDPASGRAIDKIRLYRTNSAAAEMSEFQVVFASDIKIYDATETYNSGDLVMYDEDLFKCVQNNTTGVTPVGSAAEWDVWYDNIANADLQADTLVSEDWEPPPTGMKGLCALPNGVMAGFYGNTVYLSEPYYPHAWPQGTYTDDYHYPLAHPIMALKVMGTSLVAMTTGPVYLLIGSQPDQMTPVKLDGIYPCLSKKGAAESPMGVFYPSRAGLIAVTADGLTVATETLMDEDDWSAYTPSTMHGIFHDGKYIGCYGDAGVIVIDYARKAFWTLDFNVHATYLSESDGYLYVVIDDAIDPDDPPAAVSLLICRWAASDTETLYYNWKSGLLLSPAEVNFGAARVMVDEDYAAAAVAAAEESATVIEYNVAVFAAGIDGGLGGAGLGVYGLAGDALRSAESVSIGNTSTFKLYSDGILKFSKDIVNSKPFRLPGGFRGRKFEIALEGYLPVQRVDVASGMDELYGE